MTSQCIGERVKQARERAGLTRLKLAAATDLTPNTIRNYEEDLTSPQIDSLRRIAEVTGVQLMWLIEGVEVAA